MRSTVPITEVRRNFGVFHDIALDAPVPVSKHGRASVYIVSAETYRRVLDVFEKAGEPSDFLTPTEELMPPLDSR